MSALLRTIWRELCIIARRPLLWLATLGIPLFAALFMTTIFGGGEMRELPIGVVDNDFSEASRALVRTIDSSPTLSIAHHFTSPSEALMAVRSREVYGFVVIPRNFARDMTSGYRVEIPYYYHYALLSVGAKVATTLRELLTGATLKPLVAVAQEMNTPEQEVVEFLEPATTSPYPLGNPQLDYHTYLAEPFFFVMLQIIIMLTVVYVVGVEVDSGSDKEWLTVARGNIFVALVGKLTPYAVAFIATALMGLCILHHTPFSPLPEGGVLLWLSLATVGLVVASIAPALFLFSLFPAMGLVMSVVSMVGSLGATLSGVTFPLASMYPIFRYLAYALPIRHFTLIAQSLLYTEGRGEFLWGNMAVLMAYALLPLLTMGRLRRAICSGKYEHYV